MKCKGINLDTSSSTQYAMICCGMCKTRVTWEDSSPGDYECLCRMQKMCVNMLTLITWSIEVDDFNHSLVTCFLCCHLTDIKQTFTVLSGEVGKISQMFLFLGNEV